MAKVLKNLRFFIHTFGCQMNENDSERIAGILTRAGAQKSNGLEESEIIIINTCAVREKSEEKLYSYLGRLASLKVRKKVIIGVVGCVAQLYRLKLLEKKPFIDFVLGPDNYDKLPQILSDDLGEKFISTTWCRKWHEVPPEVILRENSVSAYVPIMEGCNNFCSYCIVPFTRGREKYRPLRNIIHEIRFLAKEGFKEIQLLGQNVNSYVDPETGKNFSTLLREVNRVDGIKWVRFITSHPKNLTFDIAQAMKETEKTCHQLHLPLQSGSSSVLKRMNREYTKEEFLEKVRFLREFMPEINLSTDIIVGFPGETEKEFRETLAILKEIRFANIFSFRYSPRPLTAASRVENDVPFEEKKRRLIEVQQLQKELQLGKHKTFIGQVMRALCMGKSKKDHQLFSGRNEGYQVVNFRSSKAQEKLIGQFVNVLITGCGPYSLYGEERDSC